MERRENPVAAPKAPASSRWTAGIGRPVFGFALVCTVFILLRVTTVCGQGPEVLPPTPSPIVCLPRVLPTMSLTSRGMRVARLGPAFILPHISRTTPFASAPKLGLSLAAWFGLGGVLVSVLRNRRIRWPAFLSVLLLAATPQATTWDLAVLAESLSLSLAVGAIAAWVRMAHRPSTPAWGGGGIPDLALGADSSVPVSTGVARPCRMLGLKDAS